MYNHHERRSSHKSCHCIIITSRLAFLLHERLPPNDDISSVCGCNDPIRWTVSSDHTRTDLRTLNTSSPRYTNTSNTLQLNLDTVMGEDGGFYECECSSGFSGQLCIIVYGEPCSMVDAAIDGAVE